MRKAKKFIYNMDEVPLFVDIRYVAELFQVSGECIRQKIAKGVIKADKTFGQWRIPKTEIEKMFNCDGEEE